MMVPSTIFELWLLASPLLALLVAALALHLGAGQLRRRIALQKAAAEAPHSRRRRAHGNSRGRAVHSAKHGPNAARPPSEVKLGVEKPIRKRRSERR